LHKQKKDILKKTSGFQQ